LHLCGRGCPDCGGTRRLTTETFIARAKKMHGETYDYDQVKYISDAYKITILCPVHGNFLQRPADHVKGRGCPKCGGTAKKTTGQFITGSSLVHGKKYDYSKVNYINDVSKVCIVCMKHGEFWQTPNDHLSGHGCELCGGTAVSNTDDFVVKAVKIHGLKYNYHLVNYRNAHTKVKITCPLHGVFMQKPNSHLCGVGCPKCKESKGEREIRRWLDENKFDYKYQYRFPTCKYRLPLPFDFVIEHHGGVIVMEFQGEQHYRPVGFGGDAEKNYKKIKKTDLIKKEWCENNNMRLVEISYKEIDHIPRILQSLF